MNEDIENNQIETPVETSVQEPEEEIIDEDMVLDKPKTDNNIARIIVIILLVVIMCLMALIFFNKDKILENREIQKKAKEAEQEVTSEDTRTPVINVKTEEEPKIEEKEETTSETNEVEEEKIEEPTTTSEPESDEENIMDLIQ